MISSGSLAFNAFAIFSPGIRLSVSNTATFPNAWTPESVLLAPITLMSSPVSSDICLFKTPSTVISFGCTCHPQ